MHSFARGFGRPASLFLAVVALALAGCMGASDPKASVVEVAANAPTASLEVVGAPPTEVTVNTNYFFQPYAYTSTGAVIYVIQGKPDWLSFDPSSGMLSGTPDATQIGTSADITISAIGAAAVGTIGPFRITVQAPVLAASAAANTPPGISGSPSASVLATQAYDFAPTATDAEGAVLVFSIVNRPSWAIFNTATGRLTGTPATSSVGTYGGILIRVSDGLSTTALPAFSVQVTAAATVAVSATPSIQGNATTTVLAGSAYSFTPSATDANGDILSFQIQNQPKWATFNTATGQLYGTPAAADVGSYANIAIGVSDGKLSASLGAFTITVGTATAAAATGTAALSWTAPTTNTDGSALTNLAGYHLFYGKDPSNFSNVVNLPGAGNTSYQASNLDSGTWYFTIRAYNSAGVESAQPTAASKAIS